MREEEKLRHQWCEAREDIILMGMDRYYYDDRRCLFVLFAGKASLFSHE